MHTLTNTDWTLSIHEFNRDDIALNGNRFMLGNGYMGYRGTLEEDCSEQLVGCMLNGIYDQVDGQWREPVNAHNALFTRIESAQEPTQHYQELDIKHGRMMRRSSYETSHGRVDIQSERFVSHANVHLICMEYSITADTTGSIKITTGIDTAVWDINGPHFKDLSIENIDTVLRTITHTQELGTTVVVCEAIDADQAFNSEINGSLRMLEIDADAGKTYQLRKYVAIHTSQDCADPAEAAYRDCLAAKATGFEALGVAHDAQWEQHWDKCDIEIDGDDDAQFALRYSLYQLQLAATRHSDKVSIPARALSGQVYKGAVFWDTEMFMTPVFTLTDPAVARNLILYRYHTLSGARDKAKEYGYEGAFYAWESQESGNDACTHFNVTDVFTNRPMRTYFRDKQIHISADIVYAIAQYYRQTGDATIFTDGAAEVMIECTRFFYSYAYYKHNKDRYELIDVTGPDEYHERINNNAYTNKMVQATLRTTLAMLKEMKAKSPESYVALEDALSFENESQKWHEFAEKLYVPDPDPSTGIIPQFDGYSDLEEVTLDTLKSRVLNPNEYLGGGNGLATTTKILKQADVVLMLNLFSQDYSSEVIKANWEYYEPRTEHGSSLSACAYAMVAAQIGKADWAYRYFIKTATVDLTGKSKQYVGPLYIGGTHPAANGGAWLAAVYGFAGLRFNEQSITLTPSLPSHWQGIRFKIQWQGKTYAISVTPENATVTQQN